VHHTEADGRNSARGAVWAVASALAFSLSSVVGKDLLDALGVASLLFWRFALASLVLWAVLAIWSRRGGPDPLAVPRARLFGLGVLMGMVVVVGFLALERLDASVYIVLVYLYPAFVVLGSAALGRPLDAITVTALVIITAGVVLTVPELFTGVDSISVAGVALALGQAVLFAAYMILNERVVPPGVDGVVSAGWTTIGAAAFFAPLVAVDGLTVPEGPRLVLEVGLFALIPTVAATTCFFRALRHLAPGVMAMIMTLEVALAIVWSAVFLGEDVGPLEAAGATVVILGVVLAQRTNAVGETKVAAGV
jgi:drug/metabolite transporter (DMT)-like permease